MAKYAPIALRTKPKGGTFTVDPDYQEQWNRFTARFNRGPNAKKNAKPVPKGTVRRFKARVNKVTGPVWLGKPIWVNGRPDPNNLEYKRYLQLDLTLIEEGMDKLRFLVDITYSMDPRSKYYALYYATTGETPDEDDEEFLNTPGLVTTKDVYALIKFTGERPKRNGQPDTRRGGIYTDVVGFEEDETADEADEEIADGAWVIVEGENLAEKEEYEATHQEKAVSLAQAQIDEDDEDEDAENEDF